MMDEAKTAGTESASPTGAGGAGNATAAAETAERPPTIPADEMTRLSTEIVAALKTIYDPEIPADLYELGLIYKASIDDDRMVTIEMTLTSPRPDEPMICDFYLDPRITPACSPHRYKPDGEAVVARIYVWKGRARLRMFRGTEPTNRRDEASAGHATESLGAQITQPRAHVRALTDEAGYDFCGNWQQI